MNRFREIKRNARRDLHQEMCVPALYIVTENALPTACNVRVWRKREDPMTGDLSGFSGAMQRPVSEDALRLFLPDLPSMLRVGAIMSVAAGEAYRLDFLYPADGEWQTARVIPLSASEADGLPYPGSNDPYVTLKGQMSPQHWETLVGKSEDGLSDELRGQLG